ncbi:MAG: beta-ketoacyl synthase chain length factor [Bacteroidales bacterium]|jgi:3-oxoacyl-(acyl-carrier-protein) synthase|nr:beta-ketoacyl synthase chain length factor [Bacteroidales bacterium]
MSVYIQSSAQISFQQPLTEQWFEQPVYCQQGFMRSIDPQDWTDFIQPKEGRRAGKLLKRAIAVSLTALREANTKVPDAIVAGTGLGCVEHTENFLKALVDTGEDLLPPTPFMLSTHNTIASYIAIMLACHGYNATYSHRGLSFDAALLDAFMQIETNTAKNALVIGNDELTDDYFRMLGKIDYWKKGKISPSILHKKDTVGSFAGECSVSFVISDSVHNHTIAQIKGIEILYQPSVSEVFQTIILLLAKNELGLKNIDAVLMGVNGDVAFDKLYLSVCQSIMKEKPLLWYKHLFGESYTASGLGLHVATTILKNGFSPAFLNYKKDKAVKNIRNILILNHFQNKDFSIILLSKC